MSFAVLVVQSHGSNRLTDVGSEMPGCPEPTGVWHLPGRVGATWAVSRNRLGEAMTSISEKPTPPFPEQAQSRPGLDARMQPNPRNEAPELRGSGKLTDRVALITGGDSGIGAAVAILFAREGADVAVVHLPAEEEDARNVKARVEREGRRCLTLTGDVADSSFCKEAVERTMAEFGRLDVLVNNAAIMYQHGSLEEVSDAELDELFRVNVLGYFYMARAALRYLPRGGSIVNCGSVAGLEGNPTLIGYSETNGAIHTFTKSLATGLIDRGIRVNCVAPGPVWTPLNASSRSPEQMAGYGSQVDNVPLGRPAQPEEVAPAFLFFASNADSSYISGETIALFGGQVLAR
jgi:NAD(P)-dependent dehydrogenase (short-subunit alcohol dehydrogenase family)